MSIQYIHGFDQNTSITDVAYNPAWTLLTSCTITSGRYGSGQALNIPASHHALHSVTATNIGAIGVAIKSGASSGTARLGFYDATPAAQVTLAINQASGLITAYNGTSVQLASVTIPNYIIGNWNYIEVAVTISSTVGTLKIAIDGTTYINMTGLNTQSTANTTFANIYYGADVTGSPILIIDDLYIKNDLTLLGPQQVQTLYPNAAYSVSWTPLTSTNLSQIDETHCDSDTSYNSTNTATNKDEFNIGTLTSGTSGINFVKVVMCTRRDDAGPHTAQTVLISGASTNNGATNTINSTYNFFSDGYALDPNTGLAWTVAGVNALTVGYNLES